MRESLRTFILPVQRRVMSAIWSLSHELIVFTSCIWVLAEAFFACLLEHLRILHSLNASEFHIQYFFRAMPDHSRSVNKMSGLHISQSVLLVGQGWPALCISKYQHIHPHLYIQTQTCTSEDNTWQHPGHKSKDTTQTVHTYIIIHTCTHGKRCRPRRRYAHWHTIRLFAEEVNCDQKIGLNQNNFESLVVSWQHKKTWHFDEQRNHLVHFARNLCPLHVVQAFWAEDIMHHERKT